MNTAEYNALIKKLAKLLSELPPFTDKLLERRIRQASNRAVFLRDGLVPVVHTADAVREVALVHGVRDTKINE